LLRNSGPCSRRIVENGREVHLVDIAEPLAAVIGAWDPQIVTAESVRSACSQNEFQQVIAHEAAHIHARDNLKLLLLVAAPDALAWTPLGSTLVDRWRAAAEREADQRAAGDDPHKRVALASALIKVARLVSSSDRAHRALSIPAAMDDVPGRVRQLLEPPAHPVPERILHAVVACMLLIPVAAFPLYGLIHELIELLVRFGL
jgi:beta-lactamase regulating signal transducer with metallopeptidase domain